MLESFEAGFKAWLWPGFTAILAVAATYVVYRLALAVFRRFSESRTVIRLFLDAAARALGVVFCLLTLAGSLAAAPPDLPLMAAIQQITTLLLILAITWAAVRLTSAIGEVIVALNPVLEGHWTVSYTHLTLPTTPYV